MILLERLNNHIDYSNENVKKTFNKQSNNTAGT